MKSLFLGRFINCAIVPSVKRLKHTDRSSVTNMKEFTQKRNPITGSTEWDIQDENYDYHQEIARSAFADMLHDSERNKKYFKAIKLAIENMHSIGEKANVLDIGTGTGLLSIMAIHCGADSVVACEGFKPMAECCLKILQHNGVADKITVIPKRSTDLTVGEDGDMKNKANILVTEVFDTELIGEGALTTFSHAHKFLLEDECIVVPDSAVIYAQVVECPRLKKWNKLKDVVDIYSDPLLKIPQKMKLCAGSAAVHDIQLSQLPRQSFRELSEQIPVFYYDWSGRTPVEMKRSVKQQFTVTAKGKAQMVFMWWELNMDPEGRILLSCAPWWCHPDTNMSSERPQDTIPWRDHWMQGVYYLPQEPTLKKGKEATLISCHDEYSLWFYLEKQKKCNKMDKYKRPVCECGVHMTLSRTHVSYLNDRERHNKFIDHLCEIFSRDTIVLDLNGSGYIGLVAAEMGAKSVYIFENMFMQIEILNDYIKENDKDNVTIITRLNDDVFDEADIVICDPNFADAILPWENLKMAYLIYKYKAKIKDSVFIAPKSVEFWAMPVEFRDLHKIRMPIGVCEGVDMSIFDELVENSRAISDEEIEAQPLWEYPCKCQGIPRKLIEIDMRDLKPTYAVEGVNTIIDSESDEVHPINGFAIWPVWNLGDTAVCAGPIKPPIVGQYVDWDPHTRQAIKIFKEIHNASSTDKWGFQVACSLVSGQFHMDLNLVQEE